MFSLAYENKWWQWWAGEIGRNQKRDKNREHLELPTVSGRMGFNYLEWMT
jgi:hypothetical protein